MHELPTGPVPGPVPLELPPAPPPELALMELHFKPADDNENRLRIQVVLRPEKSESRMTPENHRSAASLRSGI